MTPERRSLTAEALGTGLLVAAVVGSGIMGERLAAGNEAVALLANTMATVAALAVLIQLFATVSGAHFNPAVTLALATRRLLPWRRVPGYWAAQIAGGMLGLCLAHLMFAEEVLQISIKPRNGAGQALSEAVASFALLLVIGIGRVRAPTALPWLVALTIGAAYWFTASTSFANPAVTLARAWTDSFVGIRPADAPLFVLMQVSGALVGIFSASLFLPAEQPTTPRSVERRASASIAPP
ncbi:MAG TPA: MIP/aquaporin family protein [Alphaproteobacteria bacterium]|nr:MIP/aquaporin family protein [Alphaproteobacteria bacterium]